MRMMEVFGKRKNNGGGRIIQAVSHLLSPSSQKAGQEDLLIETKTVESSLLLYGKGQGGQLKRGRAREEEC